MLYAKIDKDVWGTALPMSWDKVQDMFRYLNRMRWGYQLEFQTKLFNTLGPNIMCVLFRWENNSMTRVTQERRREVLLETSDHKQMEAVLFMLINEAEQENKREYNERQL